MISFPNKKYDIIYADPPWMEAGGGKIRRGANRHYQLMKTVDIAMLPVNQIAAKNCHLYLWVTNGKLQDGLRVIQAWGFRYVTMITWVKDRFGIGQYFRGQTEQCLFAVKGVIPYKIVDGKRQQYVTYFAAKRTTHSTKPEIMRRIIEKVSDREGFNKIELFARKKADGWECWGNEV